MKYLRGAIRTFFVILVIVLGTLVMLFFALFGLQRQGVPLTNWIPVYMARIVSWIFNLRIWNVDAEAMRRFRGFILPNHLTFIDIIVLYTIMPLRFLSAVEVKDRPVLGWAADAAGTVYVDRTSMRSRRDALNGIADAYLKQEEPPIVIFPEGRLGTGVDLSRFQLGVFKLARTHGIAYLPLAIKYDNMEIAIWRGREGENLFDAGWKLATYRGPLHVTMTPLDPVHPQADDNAARLADDAHDAIADVLNFPTLRHP